MDYGFGWIEPTPERRAQNERYSFAAAGIEIPAVVEKALPLPDLVTWYDQHATPQCVGYSSSWMTSINALIHNMNKRFNATWLYNQACRIGGTSNGAYIWAAMKALKDIGHVENKNGVDQPVNLTWGVQSYIWARNADQVRAAIYEDKPVVFGIPWYSTFSTPTTYNGDKWIARGPSTSWGNRVGGHGICGYIASDARQAVGLVNSWGPDYPHPVYVPYASVTTLIGQLNSECAVALDRYVEPEPYSASASISQSPSPSPEPPEPIYPYRAKVVVANGVPYYLSRNTNKKIGTFKYGEIITVIADAPNTNLQDWVRVQGGYYVIARTLPKNYIKKM